MKKTDLQLIAERYETVLVAESSAIDKLQGALDIIGFEPTLGTAADIANTAISGLRAALAKEPDERKRHLINAGISAASTIPFADVVKVLKLRKSNLGRAVAKTGIKGARAAREYATTQKASGTRFEQPIQPQEQLA